MSSHCYFPSSSADERMRKAADKARNRGEIASEWFKTHTLTPSTMPEFQRLMKEADKNYDNVSQERREK